MDTHFSDIIPSIESVQVGLGSTGYIPSRQISTALFLAMRLGKPILAEGPAGVRISVAESIDAFRSAEVVGYTDRQTLKDTLSLTLGK